VPKVQHKPIKSPRKGSNKKSKRQPKAALVWRTGLFGVPPDSVRCTREINSELATFGFLEMPSAIIHRTVRCAKWSNGYNANGRLQKCTVNSTRLRAQSQGRCQKAHRTVNSDCPVHHWTFRWPQLSEAPTVEPQRLGDMAGAPDSVRWCTGLSGVPFDNSLPQRPLWWLGL
jgi:hypothetical protein